MYRTGLFRDQPLQLLSMSSQGLVLNSEALELIREVKGSLAVVSMVGMPRTGKSYLLNKMLLNRKQGFEVGKHSNQQSGLAMWGKPVLGQTSSFETISILIIDTVTDGLDQPSRKLLTGLCTIVSSSILYNCFTPLTASAKEDFKALLLNEFRTEGFDSKVTIDCLARDCKNDSHAAKQLASMLLDHGASERFEDASVITFSPPVTSQLLLERISETDYEQLCPEFVEQLIQVRRRILSSMFAKSVNGKVFDGASWVHLLTACVEQVNAKKQVPKLTTVWRKVCEAELEEVAAEALELYRHKYRECTMSKKPVSEQALHSAHKQAKAAAVDLMSKKCPSPSLLPVWIATLKQTLKGELKEIEIENSNQNYQTTNEFLTFEYQTIERKLRTRQLKTIQDYRREMLMFHEFYKKRGNNSTVGRDCYHEFVLKKVYEGMCIILGSINEDAEDKLRVVAEAARKMELELKDSRQSAQKEKTQSQSKVDKLVQQTNELLMKEQALEEALADMKQQRDSLEKNHLSEVAKERAEHTKSIQQLRARVSEYEGKVEESERSRLMLESELRKKDVLNAKSLENYEHIIEQHKAALGKFSSDKETLLAKADAERRATQLKLQSKLREHQQTIKGLTIRLQESEDKVEQLTRLLSEAKEQKDLRTQETNEVLQSVQERKKELELECKMYEKRINENKHKNEKLTRQEEQLRVLSEQLQRVTEELKLEKAEKQKIKAVLEQKQQFLEEELKEERLRTHTLEQKMRDIASSMGQQASMLHSKNSQLDEETSNLKRLIAQLHDDVATKTAQIQTLKGRLEEKDQQLLNYLKISKEREEALEVSKSALLEQIRSSDIQRVRLVKRHDSRNFEQVERLKEQNEILREAYKEQLQQLKNSSEESLRQLKNFHALEKERLQCRIMEERSRNEKKSQSNETQTLRRLREAGHRHQQDLLELKKQLWEDQKNYKSEINRLEYQLSEQKIELEQLRNRQLPSSSPDESALQIQILNHRIQDMAMESNNRLGELKMVTTQKDKLEEMIRIKQETYKLSKESQDSELTTVRQKFQELSRQSDAQKKRMEDIQNELSQIKENTSAKQESLIVENRFLMDKVSLMAKQQEQVRNGHDHDMARFKKQQADALRGKLLEAERQLDAIQDKYEQVRQSILQMEQSHTREINRLEQDKRLLQSQLNAAGNTTSLLFRKLRTP